MTPCTQNTDRECRVDDCCLNDPNRPIVIKHIDKEMPIIISCCHKCNLELFRSMTYEITNTYETFCMNCINEIKEKLFRLEGLDK